MCNIHNSPLLLSKADKAWLDKSPLPKAPLGNTLLTGKCPPRTILGR